ncbi:MAG: hypothetical protein KAH21_07295, partial [Spirochaetaceae bacterium]|nr:hypothetical protein [Spirochaetaceae bacterium]
LTILLPAGSIESDTVLTVINKTGFTLSALYFSDINTEDWGKNVLGDNPMQNEELLTIPLKSIDFQHIHIKARDDEGDIYNVYNIDVEIGEVQITLNDIHPD